MITVWIRGEQRPPDADGIVRVESNHDLLLQTNGTTVLLANGHPLPRDQDSEHFVLSAKFEAGFYRIVRPDDPTPLQIEVRSPEKKLPPVLWTRLLNDLDGWLPEVLVGLEGATRGAVGLNGVAAPLLLQALLPLIPQLEEALKQLLEQPRIRRVRRRTFRPLHRVRRPTRETARWLTTHPEAAARVLGRVSGAASSGGRPLEAPVRRLHDTIDHPANRHIAWLLVQLIQLLRNVEVRLKKAVRSDGITNQDFWGTRRADEMAEAADRLENLYSRSFLRMLRPRPATEGALRVVVDHPVYRQVHTLSRRFLSARFSLERSLTEAPTRPDFDLYELWTFLALKTILDQGFPKDTWTWSAEAFSDLLSLNTTSSNAKLIAAGLGGILTIHFNRRFPAYYNANRTKAHSISKTRRPDFCVTWKHPAGCAWVALDAKYRQGNRNLAEALASAHLYRDALRWPAFGGRPQAAFLLCPQGHGSCPDWFSPNFHLLNRVGTVELQPGALEKHSFAMRLLQWLRPYLPPAPTARTAGSDPPRRTRSDAAPC